MRDPFSRWEKNISGGVRNAIDNELPGIGNAEAIGLGYMAGNQKIGIDHLREAAARFFAYVSAPE
jgi:hypothetical protein